MTIYDLKIYIYNKHIYADNKIISALGLRIALKTLILQ
jgi:hypothetical protein